MNKNIIQALVIGKSGHGKSEFILSLIKDEQRQQIPASGEGQTTRTSMEYNIFNYSEQELKIAVSLKDKEQFIDERIGGLNGFFIQKSANTTRFGKENFMKLFYKQLLFDNAFFSIEEFSESTKEAVVLACENLFNAKNIRFITNENSKEDSKLLNCPIENNWYDDSKRLLSNEDVKKIKVASIQIDEDGNDDSKKTESYILQDLIENFYKFVFDKCLDELKNYINENNIDLKDISKLGSKEISKFLKTQENEISFSSLVNKICIESAFAEQYKELISELNVEKLTLVDTYGLDHAEQITSEPLKLRYQKLFRQDYPQISSVLYLRDIANDDSPSELKTNIPTIFEVAPEIVSFVVFSKIDKLDSVDIKGKKAYKNIEEICDDIGLNLEDSGVSEVLIKNRIMLLKKSRFGYASKIPHDKKTDLSDLNLKTLSGIFKSIINKEHLGTHFVSIDKLMTAKEKVLKGSDIFTQEIDSSFFGWPGRTLGATRRKLQNGELGFKSCTMGSTLWSDVISFACNHRFQNMTKAYAWSEYFESENVLPTLEELFVEFSKKLQLCSKFTNKSVLNYSDDCEYCKDCDKKDICIKSIIYQNRKSEITHFYTPVNSWLTGIYRFSECAKKGILNEAISKLFDIHLISSARTHNARCLAMTFSENDTYEDVEKKYEEFFKYYDYNLNAEGRNEFECIVNSYRT